MRFPRFCKNRTIVKQLSHWLALFVTEVKKADGGKYPPNSVYQILCRILCYMRKQDPIVPTFWIRKTAGFMNCMALASPYLGNSIRTALEQIPKKLRIILCPNSKKIIFGQQEYWAVHLQKYERTGTTSGNFKHAFLACGTVLLISFGLCWSPK